MSEIEKASGTVEIDGLMVTMIGTKIHDVSNEELKAYAQRGREKYGNKLEGITVEIPEDCPDMIDIHYDVKTTPFTRLRRITGYLVGDMNRWNNAKRKEESDRVKHGYDE